VTVPAANSVGIKEGVMVQMGSDPCVLLSSSTTWIDQGFDCELSRLAVIPPGGVIDSSQVGVNVFWRTDVLAAAAWPSQSSQSGSGGALPGEVNESHGSPLGLVAAICAETQRMFQDELGSSVQAPFEQR
jgi:hypothetical protein